MQRSETLPHRPQRGPAASFPRSLRGVFVLGCCLAGLSVAAVVGAGAPASSADHGGAMTADMSGLNHTQRSDRTLESMRREFEELHGDLACDMGGDDAEWFEWQRLRRNDPFPFPFNENVLANYGISVAVSDDVAVVGSSRQVVFIPNPQDPDNPIELLNSGTVYIFRFVDGRWARVARIEPPIDSIRFRGCGQTEFSYISNIRFGSAVAAATSPNNELVVIGAPFEPFLLKGEDGDEKNPQECVNGALPQAGSVYVYRRIGGKCSSWPCQQEQWVRMPGVSENFHLGADNVEILAADKLWNNFPFEGSRFGSSVSILPFRRTETGWVGGNMIAAGAPTSIAFPNCEEAGNPGWFSGTVSTFELGGELPSGGAFPGRWVMGESLTSECFPFDQFGANVALNYSFDRDRPTILSGVARGIAWVPDPDDPKAEMPVFEAGTVLLFEHDPPEDDEGNGGFRSGRAALEGDDEKEEEEPIWKLTDVFQSPDPRPLELFGQSVEFLTSPVANDMVIVGSRLAHAAVDEDGECDDDFDENFCESGAVYVFRRNFVSEATMGEPEEREYEWIDQKLISLDPQNRGWFGESVAAYGNTLVVGAPREGMEDPGDPNEFLDAVGFVYVFSYDHEEEQWGEIPDLLLPYGPIIMNQFDQFGLSVAIHGNVTAVGAPGMNWIAVDEEGDPFTLFSVGRAFSYGRCFECVSGQSCFEVGFTGGCDTPSCCNRVCQFDPFCCSAEWDEQCVELAMMFPDDCGSPPVPNCPAFGSCCDMRDAPGCNSEGCCQAVCAVDMFCCEQSWDSCCVALAGELCGNLCPEAEPSCEGFCGFEDADGCSETCSCAADCNDEGNCCPDVCTHCRDDVGFEWCPPEPDCPGVGDCCEAGLDPGCEDEDCCFAVCTVDPSCCIDGWSECCVALAAELCDETCPDEQLSCEGRCGEDDIDGCGVCSCAPNCADFNNCCDDVCEFCEEEPGFEWCFDEPPPNCPGFGSCCEATDTPGCEDEDCCNAVCEQDLFCCELVWDDCCARLAEDLCLACPPTPQPSCEGLCGVDDPDGCGVCSCAPDCFFVGDCCEDVCDHCSEEPGFEFCPGELPDGTPESGPGNTPGDMRPAPLPRPDQPVSETAPRPTAPVGRIEAHIEVRTDQSPGVSSTAPKRR